MRAALLCSARPVKAVFSQYRYRTEPRVCNRRAAFTSRRRELSCIHRMPHASPNARRDMLVRAEERDSLLVRMAHSSREARNRTLDILLVTASIGYGLPFSIFIRQQSLAGSTTSRKCIISLVSARSRLAHDISSLCISCCWGPPVWL